MGNRSSLDSDGEFHEGMLEVSDRGLGSYRLVSVRDIFKKPLLTTSESSSTTSEDLAERCPCQLHESEEQDTLQNVVENCCRCHRPKITEPADGCSCHCHIAVEKPLKKCCLSRTQTNTTNSSGDNELDRAPSEQSIESSSSDSRSNLRMIFDWLFQTSPEESPKQQSSPEECRMNSTCDNEPEQTSPEETASAASATGWGLQTLTGWIFQNTSEESHSRPTTGNRPMETSEETSSCSSFGELSDSNQAPSEESPRSPPTASGWDFQMILQWMYQAESVNSQSSSDDRNLLQQAPSEEI